MKQKPQDTLPGALRLAAKHLKNLIVLNVLCLLRLSLFFLRKMLVDQPFLGYKRLTQVLMSGRT